MGNYTDMNLCGHQSRQCLHRREGSLVPEIKFLPAEVKVGVAFVAVKILTFIFIIHSFTNETLFNAN
jgi:hypothetical protein